MTDYATSPIFETASLVAWLKEQPAGGGYIYGDGRMCPIFKYLKSSGLPVLVVETNQWQSLDWDFHPFPEEWDRVVGTAPLTYSAACERAEALLRETGGE